MLEGNEAHHALAAADQRTISRRDLSRSPGFARVSPQLGTLDDDAYASVLDDDPDAALTLLADMAAATDERLRRLARALAGRVVVRLAHPGPARRRGAGRIRRVPLTPDGDLDVDSSLDAILHATASRRPPAMDELRGTTWARPATALCLLIDRSGSVAGPGLTAAALAAAAVAIHAPEDHSIIVFDGRAIALTSQGQRRPVGEVVDALLRLRGHGVTDLANALDAARVQLERSDARRRITVLLSDGRPTAGPDPLPAARRLEELVVIAPAADATEARAFAAAAGARCDTLRGPADVPRALGFLSGA